MEAARELVPRFRVSSRVSTFHDIPQMESLLAGWVACVAEVI